MGGLDLPIFIGEQPSLGALQHAEFSALETGCVTSWDNSFATGLHADHAHTLVGEKRIEKPDRITSTAYAGDEKIGQPFLALEHLPTRLVADDAVKIADHHRVRVRAVSGAQDVMSRSHVGHP